MATYSVPAPYPTITAAVAAANASPNPSNTVLVSPGTYHESNITITSPLTLISTSGSGSTTIDGGDAHSTPQAGILRVVGTTGDVTIGEPSLTSGGTRASRSRTPRPGHQINNQYYRRGEHRPP